MAESDIEKNIKNASSILRVIVNVIGVFAILFVLAGGAVTYILVDYFKSPGPLDKSVSVVIPNGSSLKSITQLLSQSSVIDDPELFNIYVRLSQSGRSMKAGEYEFLPNISPAQVFHKISSGKVVVRKLTIPEGLMTTQIIKLVEEAPYMTGEVPEGLKEGELLPETYDYMRGDSRAKLIRRMQKSMTQVLDKAWENRVADLPIKNKQEALILASIIEKETAVPDELRRVAAVFVNRMRKRMRLQTDPTVIYAITKGEYVLERPLRFKDLEFDSPYNTYKRAGLPPTPISNPGKAAIEATLNPLITDEIFFVADGTGGHQFASTLKEHNKNVRKWRKINRAQKSKKTKAQ